MHVGIFKEQVSWDRTIIISNVQVEHTVQLQLCPRKTGKFPVVRSQRDKFFCSFTKVFHPQN